MRPFSTGSKDFKEGHWVVAIGYDDAGVYFEDPAMIDYTRGYLTYPELQLRWHDLGSHNARLIAYGLAIWKPGARTLKKELITRAEVIP